MMAKSHTALMGTKSFCFFFTLSFLGILTQFQRHLTLFCHLQDSSAPIAYLGPAIASHQLQKPLFRASERSQWKRELFSRLDRIRKACGELCNMNDKSSYEARLITASSKVNQSFPSMVVPNVDCAAIIGSADIDASDNTFPDMPEELIPLFTVGGMMDFFVGHIFMNAYQGGEAKMSTWLSQDLEQWKTLAMEEPTQLRGTYGKQATTKVREKLRRLNVTNKSVLVIGSERPWVEAVVLGLGATRVTTLEYGQINSTHPLVETLTPAQFRDKYRDGTLGEFDAVVSHSSLEHSGLGRYGDALNPWGDVLALARAWCVTKPGGGLYLGLPTGKDDIIHNAGRVYGQVRWPLVTVNWQQLDGDEHTDQEFLEDHRIRNPKRLGGQGFLFRRVSIAP